MSEKDALYMPQMKIRQSMYGMSWHPKLPITLDSLAGKAKDGSLLRDELFTDRFFIKRPVRKPPFMTRLRHAWLVFTGRAYAFQFSEDQLEMLGVQMLPKERRS